MSKPFHIEATIQVKGKSKVDQYTGIQFQTKLIMQMLETILGTFKETMGEHFPNTKIEFTVGNMGVPIADADWVKGHKKWSKNESR